MKDFFNTIKKSILTYMSKKYVRVVFSTFLVLLVASFSVFTTWAWFTQYQKPRGSQVEIKVNASGVNVNEFIVQKINEMNELELVFDINDPRYSNTLLTGLLIGEEYIFTMTLHSIYNGVYVVGMGLDGVDGGANFVNLQGNQSSFNMCDIVSMKLDSITPDSTPAYTGNYSYRWLTETKSNNGKFVLISDFRYWDSNLGDLVVVFKLKVSAEQTAATINNNELSRKSLDISNIYFTADLLDEVGGE